MAGTGVTTASLNLRTGPYTSYPVVVLMPKGVTIKLGEPAQSGWFFAEYMGKQGFCSAAYVTNVVFPPAVPTPGSAADVTELQALDNILRHANEPYIWDYNDCSQFIVNRWKDWGFAPEDDFLDANADRMYDSFRNGIWDATPQPLNNPARLSIICYGDKGAVNPCRHVQFVFWPDAGFGQNSGNKATVTPELAAARDARSKLVGLLDYNSENYDVGGIWLPNYRFR